MRVLKEPIKSRDKVSEYLLTIWGSKLKSFCRFGDGEIAIMKGESIGFQEANSELANRLKKIIRADEMDLMIGIGYYYFYLVEGLNDFTKNFLTSFGRQRKYLLKHCNADIKYIDAGITQIYENYDDYDYDTHFSMMQKLLLGRDITLICGENVLKNIKNNALEVCRSVDIQYEASQNAYDDYQGILNRAKRIDKNRIVCIILGPTAKVLAYDLYKSGYTVWDLGHYLKDYDAYMQEIEKNEENLAQFFRPD